jgi:hypothetical protein
MFNIIPTNKHSLEISTDYDNVGNFQSILSSINLKNLTLLKDGFIAECQNYEIQENQANILFENAVSILENY